MELDQVLKARRTVRRFTDQDVPDELLRRVLGAALAMPHSGNTYDWRAIVLRRARLTHSRWSAIFDALLRQEYVAEAPVLVIWTVQPAWWVEHYRGGLDELVDQGLIDPARAGDLLETMSAAPDLRGLGPALMGDAMLGVAAVLLAAVDAGLGTGLAGCRAGALARALELPGHARVVPYGVLALGYAADTDAPRPRKPALSDVCYAGAWGRSLG